MGRPGNPGFLRSGRTGGAGSRPAPRVDRMPMRPRMAVTGPGPYDDPLPGVRHRSARPVPHVRQHRAHSRGLPASPASPACQGAPCACTGALRRTRRRMGAGAGTHLRGRSLVGPAGLPPSPNSEHPAPSSSSARAPCSSCCGESAGARSFRASARSSGPDSRADSCQDSGRHSASSSRPESCRPTRRHHAR